jgi:hypothetical protein
VQDGVCECRVCDDCGVMFAGCSVGCLSVGCVSVGHVLWCGDCRV